MFWYFIKLSHKTYKIKLFVIFLFLLLLFSLTGCWKEKKDTFVDQRKTFVGNISNIPLGTWLDIQGTITTSSGLVHISWSFWTKTIFENNEEQTSFYLTWSTKKASEDKQKRFISWVRYRTPQNVFLRLDTWYNNGKSAEAMLVRWLFDRIRWQWISFDPINDDMGIITLPFTFHHLFVLSPTSLIQDTSLIQIWQYVVNKQPSTIPLVWNLFPIKKVKTDLKRVSLGKTGELVSKSIYYLLDPTNQNIKNTSIQPSMIWMLYQENNKITRLDTTLTIPKYKERKCQLSWTKKIHTGSCDNKIRKISRSSDRLWSTRKINIQTPQDNISFVWNSEYKNTTLNLQWTLTIENKNISFMPIKFQISVILKPLTNIAREKIPTTWIVSFKELLK